MVDPGTPSGGELTSTSRTYRDQGTLGLPSKAVGVETLDLTAGVANSKLFSEPCILLGLTAYNAHASNVATVNVSDYYRPSVLISVNMSSSYTTRYPEIILSFKAAVASTTEAPASWKGVSFGSGLIIHCLTQDVTVTATIAPIANLEGITAMSNAGKGLAPRLVTKSVLSPGFHKGKHRRKW